jgi:glycerophosphoryl diester phosphodiesterase
MRDFPHLPIAHLRRTAQRTSAVFHLAAFLGLIFAHTQSGVAHGQAMNPKGTPHIEVIGHRGARGAFPENTIPAFNYGIETGADAVEFDLQMTKDGVIVVSHDPILHAPVCKGPQEKGVIHELTLAEVEQWDCGAVQNPEFPHQQTIAGTRVPTFDEVLDLASTGKFKFVVEAKITPKRMTVEEAKAFLKSTGRTFTPAQEGSFIEMLRMPGPEMVPPPDVFAARIFDRIRAHHVEDRVIFLSFDVRIVRAMKKLAPRMTLSVASDKPVPEEIKATGATIIVTGFPQTTAELVQRAHQLGMKVMPFASRKEEWGPMMDAGVDGICTDYPAGLIQFLKQRNG